jgi:hygromycin-B 7''-O-kinase
MTSPWPDVDDEEDYDLIAKDEEALRPGVRSLLDSLGVPAEPQRYPTGSLPVYAAGDHVLKLFPSIYAGELPVEAAVLRAVHGRLPTPTPGVHASGEHHGWGYVLMDRLDGRPLTEVWDRLTDRDRDRIADRLGATLAALHAVPAPGVEDWWPADWDTFVAEQRAGCAGRHRALGLPEEWAAQIPAYLDGLDLAGGEPVLLHTEIMRPHLLVGADGELSGLFDFEPAMRGAREYEFAAVGAFVAEGDPRFLGRMLRAYGYRDDQLDAALRRRLLGWLLLHYYSNLPAYLTRLPAPAEPTLESLADRWFATV